MKAAGGQVAFSAQIGASQQRISHWLKIGYVPLTECAIKIALLSDEPVAAFLAPDDSVMLALRYLAGGTRSVSEFAEKFAYTWAGASWVLKKAMRCGVVVRYLAPVAVDGGPSYLYGLNRELEARHSNIFRGLSTTTKDQEYGAATE